MAKVTGRYDVELDVDMVMKRGGVCPMKVYANIFDDCIDDMVVTFPNSDHDVTHIVDTDKDEAVYEALDRYMEARREDSYERNLHA